MYVLRSESSGRRYVGQTEELERRIAEHNCREHNPRKFTSRNVGPWILAHHEVFETWAEAMARENWLKSGLGRAWLDELLGRASPPRAD